MNSEIWIEDNYKIGIHQDGNGYGVCAGYGNGYGAGRGIGCGAGCSEQAGYCPVPMDDISAYYLLRGGCRRHFESLAGSRWG